MSGSAVLKGARSELAAKHSLFPNGLEDLQDPVQRLYCIGDISLLSKQSLAIVGARKASPYGLRCAERFAKRAAQAGLIVVSGGAIGCDQAAHRGALEGAGQTIVVLGCGADVIYPLRARALFEEVLTCGGLIISEAPWGSPVSRWGFTRRNRIIAALGWATLIVEAGLPSGTFSTADATLAQGKDVLVVPGCIDSAGSRGSNRLLLQGATPIVDLESFDDVLDIIYGFTLGCSHAVQLSLELFDEDDSEERVDELLLRACTAQPMRPEELASSGIVGTTDLLQIIRMLSALELDRKITRMRDGRYTATPS